MSAAEKEERVHSVIKTLGLGRCKDTIVGGGFRRGVSGGERKRVSIGHELLINPSAIFLGMIALHSGITRYIKIGAIATPMILFSADSATHLFLSHRYDIL